MSVARIAAVVGLAAVAAAAVVFSRRRSSSSPDAPGSRSSPVGTLSNRRNVTDEIDPAPTDVNDPAPPGSPIVGVAHSGFPAEEHRMENLARRWKLLTRWGFLKRSPPREVLEAFDRWRTFMTRRELRSMEGWTSQFSDLIHAEDWAASHGFAVHREDSTHLTDTEWEASLR